MNLRATRPNAAAPASNSGRSRIEIMPLLVEEAVQQKQLSGRPAGAAGRGTSPLEAVRAHLRKRWPEWCALLSYCTVVGIAVPFHEPWADEAQAWQMARSLSLGHLFKTYIRYEGSPGLWHFLLWILSRAGAGFTTLHWVCAAVAAVATGVLVFASPFPRYLKLALPFTYFLVFQYAVIARSYVLVPLLLFTAAYFWKKSPITVAVSLGLLANTSLHAAVISGSIAILFAVEQLQSGVLKNPRRRLTFLLSAAIVLVSYSFAIWTAWPAHDCSFQAKIQPFMTGAIASLVWGVAEPWGLSILVWIAIAFCFHGRRKLPYLLLPLGLFTVFSGAVHINLWHAGLLVPMVIFLLWITWPAGSAPLSRPEWIGRGAIVFMIGIQLLWSAYAIAFDHTRDYSPDRATAAFLKPFVQAGTPIAVTFLGLPPDGHDFWAVGIQPYFDHNIYVNQSESFWWWSAHNPTEQKFLALLPSHPPLIVAEMLQQYDGQPVDFNNAKVRLLLDSGYDLTNVFCGAQPQRLAPGPANCHLIFQYPAASRP
jgi:hypothetical protein